MNEARTHRVNTTWCLSACAALVISVQGQAVEWQVPSVRCTATGLIKVGDSTGALLSACGRPQLTESLQYPEGGVASTRYYFRIGGKEAFVAEVRAGEVVALRRMR